MPPSSWRDDPLADRLAVAAAVIELWGLGGAILFKFGLTLFVIMMCEIIGRHDDRRGKWLARFAVIISATPVVYSILLLMNH